MLAIGQRSHKIFSVGESSWLNKERKKLYVEIAKIYSKNKSSTCEIMKKEKGIYDCFSVAPQIAKLTVHSVW